MRVTFPRNKRVFGLSVFLAFVLLAANILSAVNHNAEVAYRDKVIHKYAKGRNGRDGTDGVSRVLVKTVPGPMVEEIRYVVSQQPAPQTTTTTAPKPTPVPSPTTPTVTVPREPDVGEPGGMLPPTQDQRSLICRLIGVCL